MNRMTAAIAVLAILLGIGHVQGAVEVAYINAYGGSLGYLGGYGFNVTNINNPGSLTLTDLAPYQAIIIASNSNFTDPTGIGNVAAAFADSGRGVVLTQFTLQGGWQLYGQIMTHGYSPFAADPLSGGYVHFSYLGSVYDPGNAMFSGVTPSNVRTFYQANVTLDPGSHLVANWTSGRHAIGYNSLTSSSVVALNLFPDGTFTTDPDTQRLVANAVRVSLSGHGAVPEPSTLIVWSLLGTLAVGLGWWRRRKTA